MCPSIGTDPSVKRLNAIMDGTFNGMEKKKRHRDREKTGQHSTDDGDESWPNDAVSLAEKNPVYVLHARTCRSRLRDCRSA